MSQCMQCLACRLSMRPALGIAQLWKGLSTRCIGECEPCDFPFWHGIARRAKPASGRACPKETGAFAKPLT